VWPTIKPIKIWRSPPWGWKGDEHRGMGGGNLGKDAPTKLSKGRSGEVGVKDACKLAR